MSQEYIQHVVLLRYGTLLVILFYRQMLLVHQLRPDRLHILFEVNVI